jgi:hypothetical protein
MIPPSKPGKRKKETGRYARRVHVMVQVFFGGVFAHAKIAKTLPPGR